VVVSDLEARYFAGRVEERSLVPLGEARLGRIAFDGWLRRSPQQPDEPALLLLRLRNEYAPSRVFVAGSWMSLIAWLIPAADVPRVR
jgi:hypothetical protein